MFLVYDAIGLTGCQLMASTPITVNLAFISGVNYHPRLFVIYHKMTSQNDMTKDKEGDWFISKHVLLFSVMKSWPVEYNGQLTELCGVPIARCVPQILTCVHHHDWLNTEHSMTRLAQFSQQV